MTSLSLSHHLDIIKMTQPVEVKLYHLPPTKLIPNSKHPLIQYPGLNKDRSLKDVYNLYHSNGWNTQWIIKYGSTQQSHYHSTTHECMTVMSGSATLRFGVADTVEDLEENTHGNGKEEGGIEIQANAGDVFIIPAGVAHKTFDTGVGTPDFEILTPAYDRPLEEEDFDKVLPDIKLSGFTMMGAYPLGGGWDFKVGGEDAGVYERVWGVAKPAKDPALGESVDGLVGLWK
ncbi:hypothetical protein BT63DRAFT_50578 [Microthyrium microscopicum]|uniref:Cupin type-1 domain-containing protein n=1 Tax=Microthyrium microscopicum TaxID=703497 RepID=A0A6A6U379_9PEZI|nr:hypothetical protein BT63DRAFT_50578 [Microthyrium microscopicum]